MWQQKEHGQDGGPGVQYGSPVPTLMVIKCLLLHCLAYQEVCG